MNSCIGLGLALRRQERFFDDSLAIWRQAVAPMPKDALAHVNLSMALLTEGNLAQGWAEFRWRMRLTDAMHRIGPRQMNRPRWDGQPFPGKTLLVHGEQGYGDNIQFVRLCAGQGSGRHGALRLPARTGPAARVLRPH